jgi:uncharacterized membrane protein
MSQVPLPAASPPAPAPVQPVRQRLDGVDAVRGLVMVLMALDHVRDFLQTTPYRATDLTWTTPAWFLSRLVTHLCAPTFILLAGSGIYLTQRRKTRGEMVGFLITRGLWLVLLELTVIRLCWYQNLNYEVLPAMVIWAIGWCMVLMSIMVYLPPGVVAAIGLGIIGLHNHFDGATAAVVAEKWPALVPLWTVLLAPGNIQLTDHTRLEVAYVILPWFGVMCLGYGLGPILTLDPPRRRGWFAAIGLVLLGSFVLVRGLNYYGDPRPWAVQFRDPDTGQRFDPSPQPAGTLAQFESRPVPRGAVTDTAYTCMSFVNTTKYPPSLDYLLMTLGPALLLLVSFDRPLGAWALPLIILGRVPLFFYVLHLPLVVACAAYVYWYGTSDGWYGSLEHTRQAGLGLSLWAAYLWWLFALLVLYVPCRWYARLKARSRNPLLSYL